MEDESDWKQEMESAFDELLALLADEHTMSAYELHSSGLVQSLFNCLNVSATFAKLLPFFVSVEENCIEIK